MGKSPRSWRNPFGRESNAPQLPLVPGHVEILGLIFRRGRSEKRPQFAGLRAGAANPYEGFSPGEELQCREQGLYSPPAIDVPVRRLRLPAFDRYLI